MPGPTTHNRPQCDEDEHARRGDPWTSPCPDDNPQCGRECLGYREREPGRLQLRVALTWGESVCDVITEEREDVVYVRMLVCRRDWDGPARREWTNCPVHAYLDRPLGDRKVIDVDGDGEREVPLFVPDW